MYKIPKKLAREYLIAEIIQEAADNYREKHTQKLRTFEKYRKAYNIWIMANRRFLKDNYDGFSRMFKEAASLLNTAKFEMECSERKIKEAYEIQKAVIQRKFRSLVDSVSFVYEQYDGANSYEACCGCHQMQVDAKWEWDSDSESFAPATDGKIPAFFTGKTWRCAESLAIIKVIQHGDIQDFYESQGYLLPSQPDSAAAVEAGVGASAGE